MLITTNLMKHVKANFDYINRSCNRTPLVHPYSFKAEGYEGFCFKFEANPKFISSHWIGHCAIFASISISACYQMIFEDATFLQVSIHGLFLVFSSVFMVFAYLQHFHSKAFTGSLNSLLDFEKRYLERGSPDSKLHWNNVKCMRAVHFAVHLLLIAVKLFVILWIVSVTPFPFSPLKTIPALILHDFLSVQYFGEFENHVLTEILQRMLSLSYTYIIVTFLSALGFQIILITFAISQYALCLMVIAFKRYACGKKHFI